jgi:hypothetical protein
MTLTEIDILSNIKNILLFRELIDFNLRTFYLTCLSFFYREKERIPHLRFSDGGIGI